MVRFKARHILCEVLYQSERRDGANIRVNDFYTAIHAILQELHGDYGMSYAISRKNFNVVYMNNETSIVMFRCMRGFHKLVQSCLPFVKKLGSTDIMLKTLHLSGTIRSSKKFLIKYYKAKLPRLLRECNSPAERQQVEALIAESCEESVKQLQLLDIFPRKPPKT